MRYDFEGRIFEVPEGWYEESRRFAIIDTGAAIICGVIAWYFLPLIYSVISLFVLICIFLYRQRIRDIQLVKAIDLDKEVDKYLLAEIEKLQSEIADLHKSND